MSKLTLNELSASLNDFMDGKQDCQSYSLNTENKTIVGAINEIYGKEIIANAIGEPLDRNDTFTEMSNDINNLLNTFKINMMNSGVAVESGDKFKALIDKIKGLTEGEGNKGIQFAEGTCNVLYIHGGNYRAATIETNLDFTPNMIFATISVGGSYIYMGGTNVVINNLESTTFNVSEGQITLSISNVSAKSFSVVGTKTHEYSGSSLQGYVTKWYAIGIGEEDTALGNAKQVVCGNGHTILLKNDGSLWSCGFGAYDELGLGSTDKKSTFTKVTTNINNDVKQVVGAAQNTFIIKNDGSLWACGYNGFGNLGVSYSAGMPFTQVTANINNDVKQIACGQIHTFILKNDGIVWACVQINYGQLGLGDSNQRNTFTQVTTNISDVKQIACGYSHTFLLKNDGSVWACGVNTYGELGLGSTSYKTTFTQITTNARQIACDSSHTFILKNDGSLWASGQNSRGQLGLNDYTNRTSFTQVTTNINNDVKEVICGNAHTYIIKNDGSVWACGYNEYGQLGLGDTNTRTTFTKVTTNINNDVKQVACSVNHTFIIKNDGTLWSCGNGTLGQLGLGVTAASQDIVSHYFNHVTINV